jgi:hypothetical protein
MSDRQTDEADAMRDRRALERELSARTPRVAEPTVQVPVSLIERVAAELEVDSRIRSASDLRAYLVQPREQADRHIRQQQHLSQPTPTVEPCTCPPPATHLGEGPDQDCPKHGDRFHAAPPSIADMVPGTTFTASYGKDLSGTTRWMRCTGPSRCVNVGGVRFDAYAIDPSTIRDVTPPSATPNLCPACDFDPMAPHNGHGQGCS